MFHQFFTLFLPFSLIVTLLSSCASTPRGDVKMPPKPPPERIQSTIFQQELDTDVPPVILPTSEIPEGITLKLKGRIVDYSVLATVPDPGERTVTVLATPSTPYAEVVKVLDKLHDMGFLIAFVSQK